MPDTDTLRRCVRPARAVRVGAVPHPRVRPLAEVLADLVRPAARAAEAPSPPPTVPRDPVDPRTALAAAVRMLRAVTEVLDGTRPAEQLRGVCADDAYASAVAGLAPRGGRRSPGRLRGVRVCPVAPGVVETSGVRLDADGRARALAARLERADTGWRITALIVG